MTREYSIRTAYNAHKSLIRAVFGVFALAAISTANASPPVISGLNCDSTTAGGHGLYLCSVFIQSDDPVQIDWYKNGSLVSGWSNQTTITDHCVIGANPVQIEVFVHNSSGDDYASKNIACGVGPL